MQERWDTINLQIMRIEQVQIKDTENTFNKTIAENFSILRKRWSFRKGMVLGHQANKTRKQSFQGILQL
jgi:hypothetical protein